jgi:hypothetical protein
LANDFNISQILFQAFGSAGVLYRPSFGDEQVPELNYDLEVATDEDLPSTPSSLGTPIVFPWSLKGGKYLTYNYKGEIIEKTLEEFRMPAAALCVFTRAKIMRTTAVSGGRGTVKEMYGFDDWSITVKGVMLSESNHPQAPDVFEMRNRLLQFENLTDAIGVSGDLFEAIGVSHLVINRISIPQVPGKPRMIPFEMNCVSDQPIELLLL